MSSEKKEDLSPQMAFVRGIIKKFESYLEETNLEVEPEENVVSIFGNLYYGIEDDLMLHMYRDRKYFYEITDKKGEVQALIIRNDKITWDKLKKIKEILEAKEISDHRYRIIPLDDEYPYV